MEGNWRHQHESYKPSTMQASKFLTSNRQSDSRELLRGFKKLSKTIRANGIQFVFLLGGAGLVELICRPSQSEDEYQRRTLGMSHMCLPGKLARRYGYNSLIKAGIPNRVLSMALVSIEEMAPRDKQNLIL